MTTCKLKKRSWFTVLYFIVNGSTRKERKWNSWGVFSNEIFISEKMWNSMTVKVSIDFNDELSFENIHIYLIREWCSPQPDIVRKQEPKHPTCYELKMSCSWWINVPNETESINLNHPFVWGPFPVFVTKKKHKKK